MSADNGIYILKTKDGFRVTHAQAIDNIVFEPDENGWNPFEVWAYFHAAAVHQTSMSALRQAMDLAKEVTKDGQPLEYGICTLDYRDLEFPNLTLADYENYERGQAEKFKVAREAAIKTCEEEERKRHREIVGELTAVTIYADYQGERVEVRLDSLVLNKTQGRAIG